MSLPERTSPHKPELRRTVIAELRKIDEQLVALRDRVAGILRVLTNGVQPPKPSARSSYNPGGPRSGSSRQGNYGGGRRRGAYDGRRAASGPKAESTSASHFGPCGPMCPCNDPRGR